MVKAGITDPTKIILLARQNAASVVGLLVTTEPMVAEKPEKKATRSVPRGCGMEAWTTLIVRTSIRPRPQNFGRSFRP
jgi:hypothetical protein